jgi:hypothetical protein
MPVSCCRLLGGLFDQGMKWADLQAPLAVRAVIIIYHQPTFGHLQCAKRANTDACRALVAQGFIDHHIEWFSTGKHEQLLRLE